MADKKDSQLTVKAAIVSEDRIPLLDSETIVDEEKNKTISPNAMNDFIVESGSWEPLVIGATLINSVGYWHKTKEMLSLKWSFTMPVTAEGSTFSITGLPEIPSTTGEGKPSSYYGFMIKTESGVSIETDNVAAIGAGGSGIFAFSTATPNGRPISYFSDNEVVGSISYVVA